MDGERDLNLLKANLKDKNIFSSSFCSADIIVQLLPLLKNSILIVDEFHNLSLNKLTDVNNNMYKILNYNTNKKIFLSATPKIYNKVSEEEYDELETNNFENIFGKIEYSYSFTDAIKNKYINDYILILPNINEEKDINDFIYSNMLYYGYRKCIVYCKNIDECKQMKIKIEKINKAKYNFDIYLNKINYHTSIKKRKTIIDKFKQEKYKLSMILSVHTLDECIDIPECDSIYFTSDVKNPINIIQRMCRSMRIYENKIKSGIFVWCNNYKNIKNIKKTILENDDNLQFKINIKNKKSLKENIEKIFTKKNIDKNIKNNNSFNIYDNKNINDSANKTIDNDTNMNNKIEIIINHIKNINHDVDINFIKDYYILTHDNFISIVEFTKWINVNRQSIIENLQKNYKINVDYFIVSLNEEIECIKLYKKESLIFKPNQKFIKITQKCFKDICIRSTTTKGNLFRKYYIEFDNLIKCV
jgi:superfamily II DNA or RNA helicase